MTSFRPLPQLTELNRDYWTGGADGILHMQRCGQCRRWQHPAGVICPDCLSRELASEPLSGMGTVEAFTINHQPWIAGVPVPYTIAIVSLDEQKGLNLTTNIVGVDPDAVRIGQRVKVLFEAVEDVFIPQFTPVQQELP